MKEANFLEQNSRGYELNSTSRKEKRGPARPLFSLRTLQQKTLRTNNLRN
jgi:hypothetical protein